MTKVQAGRPPLSRWLAAAAALLLALLVSVTIGQAQDGVGEAYFECRDAAWESGKECYEERGDSFWGRARCNIQIELDLLGCTANLVRDLNPLWGK
jgi:hypothetical protein